MPARESTYNLIERRHDNTDSGEEEPHRVHGGVGVRGQRHASADWHLVIDSGRSGGEKKEANQKQIPYSKISTMTDIEHIIQDAEMSKKHM